MWFCQGSAPSPALLFTGMKKGIEHFSAVHIVLRCLKELLKSTQGGGRAKRNHRSRKGVCEGRISAMHLQSKAASSMDTSNTSTLLSPSLPDSPSAGLGVHLFSKVWKFWQCIDQLDTSLVEYFVLGTPSINCLPREWLHDTLISFFLWDIWDIIWLKLSGCSLLFSLLWYCTVWITVQKKQ